MKKLSVYLSIGVLVLGLTACGSKADKKQESTTPSTESVLEGEDIQGVENSNPAGEENEGEDLIASDTMQGWSEDMTAARQAVVDILGDNYWPNMPVSAEMLESTYGITADMYDDFMAEVPMISANVDTLLIIKAKDGKVEDVEKALNMYRDALVNDTMQYPMNLGKIQASRIERFGNYVCFVQLGAETPEDGEDSTEASVKHCQEQNELVLEVLGQKLAQ